MAVEKEETEQGTVEGLKGKRVNRVNGHFSKFAACGFIDTDVFVLRIFVTLFKIFIYSI